MLTRVSISTLLIIAVAVWGGFLWFLGIELSWDYAKPYTFTLGVLTALVWLFDKHLWRFPIFSFLGAKPSLVGTWRVELESTYRDPKTGEKANVIKAFAVIRQTYSMLSIRIMSEESESFLVASRVEKKEDGTCYIYGVYQSDPEIHQRGKSSEDGRVSEIHYGSFKYKLIGSPTEQIDGHYWTDRHTNGSIKFIGRRKGFVDSYGKAIDQYDNLESLEK